MKLSIVLLFFVCTCVGNVPSEVRQQYERLHSILVEADHAYFNQHNSIMSDDAYEHIRSVLEDIVDEYSDLNDDELVFPEKIGNQKIAHFSPVLSLKKAYSSKDLDKFVSKVGIDESLLIQPKIDGVSVVLNYKNGRFVQALTRGNSLTGNDVTKVLLASAAVPLFLAGAPANLWVRGEFFINKAQFIRINERRLKAGMKRLSNARNAASGTLMSKDVARILMRKPEFLVFDLIHAEGVQFSTDVEALAFLEEEGFPVVSSRFVKNGSDLEEILSEMYLNEDYPFETDGFVVKVNDLSQRIRLGQTKKYPRWAIAKKYRSLPIETVVLEIEISVSDQAKRTPVAILKPVSIDGVTVKRASLHSENILRKIGVKVGSRVKVIRAGGVTPEIVGVVDE